MKASQRIAVAKHRQAKTRAYIQGYRARRYNTNTNPYTTDFERSAWDRGYTEYSY